MKNTVFWQFDFRYRDTNKKDRSQSGLFRFTLNCTRTCATTHNSSTRLLTGSPCPAAGGRKRGAVNKKKYRVQRPLQGQLHDNISDRSQVRNNFSLNLFRTTTPPTGSSCSFLAITLLSLRDISPVRGLLFNAKKFILARNRVLL